MSNFFTPTQLAQANIDLFNQAKSQELPGRNTISDITQPEVGLGVLVAQILSIMMTIGALMVFIYFLWGAISWISAGGDKGKIEEARNRITTSVIGIIVLASIVAIFKVLQLVLGIEVLKFI
ncbi:MAG: hypothetical protein A2632_01905 [Candidatus Pacebacteria bacterium RIFCSPHIGHO2_01_FULL_46_16]|nr:MAG: hypothetical protein A2632_01905 [Candidatus Pacebacteria bacterium RIFCSPHIGHO2_01_FULL_46_16]OGJ20669.1 MAG: hypothetical protein A3J60_00600 [Candidatus Pacebacteria bacterium RIFCSPHIGHO2_02_FULL_46_9]